MATRTRIPAGMTQQRAEMVVKILEGAKAKLKKRKGWVQGSNHMIDGGVDRYCSRGAVDAAMRDLQSYAGVQRDLALGALSECIPRDANGWAVSIVSYNDAPKRKKKEILRMFDCAIAAVRKVATVK